MIHPHQACRLCQSGQHATFWRPGIRSVGSGQCRPACIFLAAGRPAWPPRNTGGSRSRLWIDVGQNATIVVVQTRTAGMWPRPVANTMLTTIDCCNASNNIGPTYCESWDGRKQLQPAAICRRIHHAWHMQVGCYWFRFDMKLTIYPAGLPT